MFKHPKYLGMRTIKTSIAVALVLIFSYYVKGDVAFFAIIAAIGTMHKTIVLSIKRGLTELAGTATGATLGMGFVLLFGTDNIILVALFTIFVIMMTNILKIPDGAVLASIIFTSLATGFHSGTMLEYSLERFLETLIGFTISILVNVLFLPYNNSKKIISMIEELEQKFITALVQRVVHVKFCDVHNLYIELFKISEELTMFTDEYLTKKHRRPKIAKLFSCFQLLETMYNELVSVTKMDSNPIIDKEFIERLSLLDVDIENSAHIKTNDEKEQIVFNFHIKNFLDAYDVLQDIKKLD